MDQQIDIGRFLLGGLVAIVCGLTFVFFFGSWVAKRAQQGYTFGGFRQPSKHTIQIAILVALLLGLGFLLSIGLESRFQFSN